MSKERLRFYIATANVLLKNNIVNILNDLYNQPLFTFGITDYDIYRSDKNWYDLFFVDIDLKVKHQTHDEFKLNSGLEYFIEKRNELIQSNKFYFFVSNDQQKYNELKYQFNIKRFDFFYLNENKPEEFRKDVKTKLKSSFIEGHPYLRKKDCLLFIHGFSGNINTFASLKIFINADADLNQRFIVENFDYRTFSLKYFFRSFSSAGINDLADALIARVNSLPEYDEITFVGHSMGCVIITGLLIKKESTSSNKLSELSNINVGRVLFYAGAIKGSYLASISFLLPIKIRHLDELRINSKVLDYIKNGWSSYSIKSKYKISYFVSTRELVVRNSHLSEFFSQNELTKIDASHSSIIEPKSHDDVIYSTFKKSLLK